MKTARRNLMVLIGVTLVTLTVLMAFGCGDDSDSADDQETGADNKVVVDDAGASDIDPNSASAAVEKYYTALMGGDCTTAYAQYYVDPADPQAQAKIDSYIQDCEAEVVAKGPVEGTFMITSEEPAADTAIVKAIITDSRTGDYEAVAWNVKQVDGQWRLLDL